MYDIREGKKMSEKKKKIKDVIGSWCIKAGIFFNAVLNIGSTTPTEILPKDDKSKDTAKEYVTENSNTFFNITNLDEAPVDMLDMDKLTQNLINQKITLSDIITSGVISRDEITKFHYTQEDLNQMSGSKLMEELQTQLENNAERRSQELCTKYVREAWRDVTNQNQKNYCLGVYSEEFVAREDLWCSTERGYAKDWIDAVKKNSSSLVYLGNFKNTDFDLHKSPGFVCVVPGEGDEPGHTFFCKEGKQYSDFVNEADWILDNMNGKKYKNEIHVFISADTPAPEKLVKAMLENKARQSETAKELCQEYKLPHKDFLNIITPFDYSEITKDPYKRIAEARKKINNMENTSQNKDKITVEKGTAPQKNINMVAANRQHHNYSNG